MQEHGDDWQAQSIEMIRRNPANAFDVLIGRRVYVGEHWRAGDKLTESGPRADDTVTGIWRGRAGDAWQVMALLPLPGPRNLQLNIGYTVRDLFDNGNIERPVHSARYRLPVVRLPLKVPA